jgi:cell division protease FtsH
MRGTGLGGGHDEREQTLNQILVEMDGFDNDTNIIVIAATNRADVLDPALMRPGRFDRKVYITRPDVKGREEILAVHTRGKPLLPDVDLQVIAKLTPGFAGADLENLVNEAAIISAQRAKSGISMQSMQDAMEKIVAGPERRSRVVSPEEQKVVAYHEAGHAVVMHHLEHSDPVHKITIIPRGQAGGYTMSLPESMDSGLMLQQQLEDMIVGLLGGRAAEELTFGQITTGASNDLERTTSIARAMVTRYGMSERLGLRVYGEEHDDMIFLGRSLGEPRNYSDKTARTIDEEVDRIIEESYNRARKILTEQNAKLEKLAQMLLQIETVDREQFEALMEEGQEPVAA